MATTNESAPDGLTLIEVIRILEEAGYTGQFAAGEGGMVRCFTCRASMPAPDVQADRICRTEGTSDPADMVAVVAVRCPRCGARGTLALKYGPGATPEEAETLAHLDDSERKRVQATANGLSFEV